MTGKESFFLEHAQEDAEVKKHSLNCKEQEDGGPEVVAEASDVAVNVVEEPSVEQGAFVQQVATHVTATCLRERRR